MRFRSSQNGSTYISAFTLASGWALSTPSTISATSWFLAPIANITNTSIQWIHMYSASISSAWTPIRYSPALYIAGRAWNTTSAANNTITIKQELRPVSWTTISADYVWAFDNNNGWYNDILWLNSAGKLWVGITPTAYLHLKAGTATAGTAPIKLVAWTSLATPEAWTIEFDWSYFYLSI
jgi:hypothetical protein